MTENPATSSEHAAALLGTVGAAQSATRRKLRARMPEFSALVAVGSFAAAVGKRGDTSEVLQMVAAGALLSLFSWVDSRRRHRVGGHIDAAGWIAIAVMFVAGVTCNLTLTRDARETATAVCLCVALVILAAVDRTPVLAVPVLLILVAVFAGHGALGSVLSAAAGVACVFVVRRAVPRRRRVEDGA